MRKEIILVGIISLMAISTEGRCAVYYVDYDLGNNDNDGRSVAAPWKHCPGDSNATSITASTVIGGGDRFIFRGGVRYKGKIQVTSGTSVSNQVQYDGNSDGTWGAGKAIIDGEYINSENRRYGFYANGKSYFTINNFEIVNMGGYLNLSGYNCSPSTPTLPSNDGYGVYLKSVSFATISNCYIHEIGIWQNASPAISDGYMGGYGIRVHSGSEIDISNNEMTKVAHPVQLDVYNSPILTIKNVKIHDNDFHNYIRWCVSLKIDANNSVMNGIEIFNNKFHDFTEYDNGVWSGCLTNPHTNGIIFIIGGAPYKNASLGSAATPIRIYNNSFYQSAVTGNGGTAMIFFSNWGGTVYVYNNTFSNVRHRGEGAIYVQDGTREVDGNPNLDYHFYNNTFYDNMYGVFLRSLSSGYELSRAGNVINVENNIFYKANEDSVMMVEIYDAHSMPTVLDYNAYYTKRMDKLVIDWRGNGGSKSINDARGIWGFEEHGVYADPGFVDISYGIGTNTSLNNLGIRSNSSIGGSGINLSGYFSVDKSNKSRQSFGNWSIGAYGVSVTEPINLKIK